VAEAASALALANGLAGRVPEAREHHGEAVAALDGLDDRALAERIEIFFYLAWAETYIEELELSLATAERGIALSRATGQGHLLVPLMLSRPLPLDGLGRLAESIAAGEEAIEAARTSPNPQYLFWALWECAYSHAMAGNIERALELCEESTELSRDLAPNFLFWSQPASTYGHVIRESGEAERGLQIELDALGGPEMPRISAYERVIALQQLTEALVAAGRTGEAAEFAERARADAERLGLPGTRALAAQAQATVLLARGEAAEAARLAAEAWKPTAARGLRLDAAHLRRLEAGRSRRSESARRPSPRCGRPSRSSTRFHRCAHATRSGGSSASWAPGQSRAARPPTAAASRRSARASGRSLSSSPTAGRTRRSRRSCTCQRRPWSRTCGTCS
jgi:tetratricopeptide (TPR) repeat protein